MKKVLFPTFDSPEHMNRFDEYWKRMPNADVYWRAGVYALTAAKPELVERLARHIDWENARMPEHLDQIEPGLSSGEKRFARSVRALVCGDPIDLYDFFSNPYSKALVQAALWLFDNVG